MARLGDLLVEHGLITQEQLLHALQIQSQFGGRVGTNLVELGYLSEQNLTKALSRQLNIPCAGPDDVANIPPHVITLVPRNLAQKYRAVPFRVLNRVVYVCMSDPSNLQDIDALRFSINLAVKPFIITEMALNYALERYYGVAREPRFFKVSPNSAATFVQLASPEDTAGPAEDDPKPLELLDPEDYGPHPTAGASARSADLRTALADIKSHAELLQQMKRFIGSLWRQSLLLSVTQGHVVAAACDGLHVAPEALPRIRTPITEGSLVHEVLSRVRIVHRPHTDDGGLLKLCGLVKMPPRQLTLLPILENRRIVYLALCHGLGNEQLKAVFEGIRTFLGQVSCALQILTLRQQILETPGAKPPSSSSSS